MLTEFWLLEAFRFMTSIEPIFMEVFDLSKERLTFTSGSSVKDDMKLQEEKEKRIIKRPNK